MEHSGSTQLVKVFIPDAKTEKCIVLDMSGSVWTAKQKILDKVYRELPRDPLNYSLYLPPSGTGKLGKFLDDGLRLSDYSLHGNLPKVEVRYKSRNYTKEVALTEKLIIKANSKANQRRLVEYVTASSQKRIEKLLDSGLDPNFLTDDGNTPLGLACGRGRSIQCIQSLLSKGAHIDFRGKDGLTPLHRAAIGGNALAVNSLLSYGASPNYRDVKGLTPLYHTAIMGDDTGACITLLRHRAEIGVKDQGGWSELHHTSKYGHIQHAELFIRYGADINDQNLVGNTPLHVAASHGQRDCALMLLRRGADKTKINFAGQSPSQVAILCGHHQLATEITGFPANQVDLITIPPEYNENARQFAPRLHTKLDTCPISPKDLSNILEKDYKMKEEQEKSTLQVSRLKDPFVGTGRPGSASSQASSHRARADTDSISVNSYDIDSHSTHSNSTGAPGTPGPSTPLSTKKSFTSLRERLYRAGPGKYVVIQDVEPQQPGDIALSQGMSVEVTYIGKGGYWEGRAGGGEGWFPRLAIKEMGEEQYDYPSDNTTRPSGPIATSIPKVPSTSSTSRNRGSNIHEINIYRGNRSYGFAMRGVRATTAMTFQPTPEVPALQYVGSVEENGAAAEAGLIAGDFIIEVEGVNVTHSTHDEVVKIVRKAGEILHMKVITPLIKPKSVSQQYKEQITPVSTPESLRKEPPIPEENPLKHSAIDKETIIGEGASLSRTDSPLLTNYAPTGWDSSQDEDTASLRATSQLAKSHFSIKSYSRESPTPSPVADVRSHTLPVLPSKDYPQPGGGFANADDVEEDREEEAKLSAFELALRENKQKINRKSGGVSPMRGRANTVPEKAGSPFVQKTSGGDDGKSDMSRQILEASRARKERVETNQVRMNPQSVPRPLRGNPLANALSSRIKVPDPVDSDETDSETEDSYSPFQAQLLQLPKKGPPPATKPKPLKKAPSSPATSNWLPYLKSTPDSPLLKTKHAHSSVDMQSPPTKTQDSPPEPIPSGDSLDFDLPPPLLSEEKRPPSLVDMVEPPTGFSLDKIDDDLTDDFIPPPLPQTSPPPTKTGEGPDIFIYPDSSPTPPAGASSNPVKIPKSQSIDMLPSPMPSPPSSENLLDISGSVVPPPEFVNQPLGFDVPPPKLMSPESPKSPESEDTPPPLPNEPPPPLELEEQNDSQTGSFSSVGVAGTKIPESESTNDSAMEIPSPRTPLLVVAPSPSPAPQINKEAVVETTLNTSVAPELTPKPQTGFNEDAKPAANDQTSSTDAESGYKRKQVGEWEVEDVCEWLKDIGLGEYATSFEENEIVGEHITDLSKEDLKDLGIKKIGHQKKFSSKLATLLK